MTSFGTDNGAMWNAETERFGVSAQPGGIWQSRGGQSMGRGTRSQNSSQGMNQSTTGNPPQGTNPSITGNAPQGMNQSDLREFVLDRLFGRIAIEQLGDTFDGALDEIYLDAEGCVPRIESIYNRQSVLQQLFCWNAFHHASDEIQIIE